MNEENEEFNERFETIEQALKYVADSQAKSEWVHKKDIVEARKRQLEFEKRQLESEKLLQSTQKQIDFIGKHLAHVSKLAGIAFEDLMFHDEKFEAASEALKMKNPNRT